MDRQHNEAHTFCKKCCRYIKTTNFLIHQNRCNGISQMSESRESQRIFNNSRYPQRPNNRSQDQEQTIPCHYCGYLQTFAELDTHPNRCEHREEQCPRCQTNFPKSLMSQHKIVCPVQPEVPVHRQQQYENQEEEEENFFRRRQRRQSPPIHYRRRQPLDFLNMMMMNEFIRQRERPLLLNNLHQLIQLLASEGVDMEERGMTPEEIKKYPITEYKSRQKKQEQDEMCIICYCNFEEGQKCLSLPCKHFFHPDCIQTWLEKNPTCPLCKCSLKNEKKEEPQRQSPRNGIFRIIRQF